MSKQKFESAKILIDQKKYGDARKILKTIDHPTARVWERKLDALDDFAVPADLPKVKPKGGRGVYNSMRGCLFILIAFVVVWAIARPSSTPRTSNEVAAAPTKAADVAVVATSESAVTIIPTVENRSGFVTMTPGAGTVYPTATITETPTPTITPTITMVPNATVTARPASLAKPPEVLIKDAIDRVDGIDVLSVQVADGRANGGERVAIIAYTTQTTDPDLLITEMGTLLGALAVTFIQNDLDIDSVSIIIGPTKDIVAGIATVQASDVINYGNGIITLTQLFAAMEFTSMTDTSTSSSGARSIPQQPAAKSGYPDNCDEAVAMGLTAAQAGAYSHLDRDDDGVACYGD